MRYIFHVFTIFDLQAVQRFEPSEVGHVGKGQVPTLLLPQRSAKVLDASKTNQGEKLDMTKYGNISNPMMVK